MQSLLVLGLDIQHCNHIRIFLKLHAFIFKNQNRKLYSADRDSHNNLVFLSMYLAIVCTV